jgi:hypothetical protein
MNTNELEKLQEMRHFLENIQDSPAQIEQYTEELKTIIDLSKGLLEKTENNESEDHWPVIPKEVGKFPIYTLNMRSNFAKKLHKRGYRKLKDLKGVTGEKLKNLTGIGARLIEDLEKALTEVQKNPDVLKRSVFTAALEWKNSREEEGKLWKWKAIELSIEGQLVTREIKKNLSVQTTHQTVANVLNDFFQHINEKGFYHLRTLKEKFLEYINKTVLPVGEDAFVDLLDANKFNELSKEFKINLLVRIFEDIPFRISSYSDNLPEELIEDEEKIVNKLREIVSPISSKKLYYDYLENHVKPENIIKCAFCAPRIISEISDDSLILRSKSLRTEEWIRRLLEDQEEGIHEDELCELYEQRFSEWYGPLKTDHPAGNLDVFSDDMILVDNRTIGLIKHLDIKEEKISDALDDLYGYFKLNKGPDFMARCEYILEWLKKKYDLSITPHVLAEFMRKDSRFQDLGRMVFTLAEGELDERIHYVELVTEVLKKLGSPAKKSEILKEVNKKRTTKMYVLDKIIEDSDNLYFYGKAFCGLKPLDQLELDSEHPLAEELEKESREDKKGLSLMDVLSKADTTQIEQLKKLVQKDFVPINEFKSRFSDPEAYNSFKQTFSSILKIEKDSIQLVEDISQEIEEMLEIETEVF